MEKIKDKIKSLKIADYFRKSSRDGEKQVASIPSQIEECGIFRKANNLPEPVKVYEESRSAKYANKRVGFSEMLLLIQSGQINAILCWHLNRIARNMTEGGILIDLLSEGKLVIITTNGDVYDETSDMSVVAQLFGASKQYSIALSRDVKRGQRDKAKNKGLPQGLATLAFLNSKQGEKGERWWLVDEERFWKVQKLFELFLTGRYSIGKLHKYAVEELKLTTPKRKKLGGLFITRASIGKMLRNPVYAGFFIVQGERYELTGVLPRIICESQYNLVLQILGDRCNPKVQKHQAVFSGFITSDTGDFIGQDIKHQLWCDCRHKFSYRDKTNCPKCNKKIEILDNPEYFIQSYYYNNRKKKAGLEYHSITEEKVTCEIVNYVDENLQLPTPLLDWAKKYIHEIKNKEVDENLKKVKDRDIRNLEYENKKKKAVKLFIEGKIDEQEKIFFFEEVEKEYADIKVGSVPKINWVEKLNELFDLTSTFKDIMQTGTFEAKRSVLTRLGSNWVWNDKELLIHNTNAVNTLISGIKTLKPILSKFGNEKALVEQGLNDDNSTLCITLRKRWDSNPRYIAALQFSRLTYSTALPRFPVLSRVMFFTMTIRTNYF